MTYIDNEILLIRTNLYTLLSVGIKSAFGNPSILDVLNNKEQSKRGACVEACDDSSCPPGMECLSNGCGHECMPAKRAVGVEKRGACVEACDDSSCPPGMECLSNGCGHECMPAKRAVGVEKRGACVEACDHYSCPAGMECRSNGCGHECMPAKRAVACPHSPPLCNIFCISGLKIDEDGCQICECNDGNILIHV